MATAEELREELEQERTARQELEAALQEAAKYGQELLVQVQEQEQALAEYREKASSSRRMSQHRRASTVAFGSDRRVAFLPGTADSDDEDGKRPAKPTQRRGRGGKSMMVEDLMQHNQSLEEDVRRLQQKLNEEVEEDSDEDEGQIRPKRRSRRALRAVELEDQTEEAEMEEDYEAQIIQLQQQLQAARKESATTQKSLQAELDAKKQELQEHFQAEQDAKASSAQIEAKLKALQKQWDVLVQQNRQVEEELHNAKTKERELTFQLEQQTLRNEVRHSTRNWMPASEEALRNAAPQPSLADEFQDMEGEREEEDENEDRSESEKGDLQNQSNQAQARIEALQFELQSVQAGATKEIHQQKERHDASQAESTKEIKELQEKLAATKAEAAAAVQEHETFQEQTQAVLAENARLRQEVQILEEANEVRTNGAGGTRPDVEESFWSKVLGTIACARTTPERSASPCRNPELQLHLAMPETEAAAAGKAN